MTPTPTHRPVAMLDLAAEFGLFGDRIRAVVNEVLESQRFIGGPAIAELESKIAKRVGVAHAIAVSSGTDALLCALMTLGVGPGDEVIVPSFTFFATAGSVARVGATPVFVDIDERTFNLDPNRVREAMTSCTKAIIAVHLFGQCADMDAIREIAREGGVRVIEDAAQALGASYHGQSACAMSDLACLSFYPTKNLGGFGEGGMVLTDDDELGALARQMRVHGESSRYHHERVGGNFRLDTMKAAILSVKLDYFDEFTERRRQNAKAYGGLLRDAGVTTPFVPDGHEPVYHQYSVLANARDELVTFLRERDVQSGIYYPVGLHDQACFKQFRHGDLPVTERACRRILSLPCHPMLTDEDLAYVASCVRAGTQKHGRVEPAAGSVTGAAAGH